MSNDIEVKTNENEEAQFKVKGQKKGGFATYRALVHGDQSMGKVILGECLTLFFGGIPGALGLLLRAKLYPLMFPHIGRKVIFGRNLTLRHTHKIHLGDNVVIDDNAVIDAKGVNNRGIEIGDGVYIGRNTIVYCKGGNIKLRDRANLSSNCQVFSSNDLTIGAGCMIGAYSYLLSGGEYDHKSEVPFADQDGMETKGPCVLGDNCWLGARVTVLDGVTIGENSVLAAGAVVTKSFPAKSIVGGVPAKEIG
ncbi:MAG: acyltransferase [Verrucomicrobia bacterium]|nr:acyltransferase [Verrucomicrobiota bacterium]MCH8511118.1 acyltransferase [Kiritimatiellia bacterium]